MSSLTTTQLLQEITNRAVQRAMQRHSVLSLVGGATLELILMEAVHEAVLDTIPIVAEAIRAEVNAILPFKKIEIEDRA